ncbi:putative ABC transport system permease protein [Peptoniphilus asaccharolyticus DSM 20463]|uniref:Putative ABC transport system permease protein n=2 Tax=Peptoniphilus asaccharolyticus TaxID=1258 RepID=A0A1W1VIY3_PEPAS|nr:ABC transporter permease [Peptoniphilus asaccharolyticus]SMB93288.1 putative ABC transport system permease protein [Peptoniphilus asaccharolyticus DSM 20463]
MNILENIKMALEGLKLNKMRSFLTMLGIIIGIASVIAILTIGQAMSKSVADGFDKLNKNMFQVKLKPREGYNWYDIQERDYFKPEDTELIKQRFGNFIKFIVIQGNGKSAKIKTEQGKNLKVNINSSTEGAKEIQKLKMLTGEFYNEEDVQAYRDVCIISDKVAQGLFGGYSEALGKEVEVDTGSGIYVYRCKGVYKNEVVNFGAFGGQNEDSTVLYIPYTVGVRDFENNDQTFMSFTVITNRAEDIDSVSKEIEKYFNENKFLENEAVQAEAKSIDSELQQITSIMSNVKLAIGGIAAISLLVGGIGVMNILLVSVTERTREIGVRKALGATSKDIRGQFITESIIICIIGGIIGVLLGGLLGYFASSLMKLPTLPNIFSIAIAVGFSMSIGIFFGYYPANKAAKLNPIDALRYE